MAKPDLDDGFIRVAHDLDAALAIADFTKGARIVLREVFAQAFGKGARSLVEIHVGNIAKRSDTKRQYISRGFRELIDSNILIEDTESGFYAFNKRYETWTKGGEKRISEGGLAYCRGAKETMMRYFRDTTSDHKPNPYKPRANPVDKLINPVDTEKETEPKELTTLHQNSCGVGTNPVDNLAPKQLTLSAAYRGTRRGEGRREKGEEEVVVVGERASTNETPTQTDPESIQVRTVAPPDAPKTLDELHDWYRRAYPDEIEDVWKNFKGWVNTYEHVWWIQEAIVIGFTNRESDIARYIHGCLRNWRQTGGPPLVDAARPKTLPTRASPMTAAERRRAEFKASKARMPLAEWLAKDRKVDP